MSDFNWGVAVQGVGLFGVLVAVNWEGLNWLWVLFFFAASMLFAAWSYALKNDIRDDEE
jgi:hypothetical protein